MKKSKTVVYLVAGIVLLFVWRKFGTVLFLSLTPAVCFCSEYMLYRMRRNARKTEMRDRVENIYVVGGHPDGGYEIYMPRHEGKFMAVPHRDVRATVGRLKREMEWAGNDKGRLRPDGRSRMAVEVFGYIFGHGENARETWEEYLIRVEADITDRARKQHTAEQAISQDYYNRNLAGQKLGNSTWEWPGTFKAPKS